MSAYQGKLDVEEILTPEKRLQPSSYEVGFVDGEVGSHGLSVQERER